MAAYTGLRFGELRALRWRDVDWGGRNLHVRRNAPTSAPAKAGRKVKKPKSKRGRGVPLIDQAIEVLEWIGFTVNSLADLAKCAYLHRAAAT